MIPAGGGGAYTCAWGNRGGDFGVNALQLRSQSVCHVCGVVDTDWPPAALCIHDKSMQVLQSDCDRRNVCRVHASTAYFGYDACRGVRKYVYVEYTCRSNTPTLAPKMQRSVQPVQSIGTADILTLAHGSLYISGCPQFATLQNPQFATF
jgi:hypothetical protein